MEKKELIIVPTMLEAKRLFPEARWGSVLGYPSFEGKGFVVVVSGAGKVNAALCTCRLLSVGRFSGVLLAGIAGAYPDRGLDIGDLIAATEEVYGDELFEPLSFKMRRLGGSICHGRMLTLTVLPESIEEAKRIALRFNAVAENMEGAAVAHAASMFGVVPAEVRAISNIAGVRDKSHWNIDLALSNLRNFLLEFFS